MAAQRTLLILMAFIMSAGVVLSQEVHETSPAKTGETGKPLVTFVELGSVKCVPCRQMQPVMAAIEKKYGNQIAVVFYDVWKPEQHEYAETYGIRVIPTQVFLDKDGKEFFRHEGFYPEPAIDSLLQKHGLKIRTAG